MIDLPNLGDTVRVWPMPGSRVQDGEGQYGRFLASAGRTVTWDTWWHRRLLEGAVVLHDPAPAPETAPLPANVVRSRREKE